MSYQVIARKWRPQKFDDVVGQQAVTRTLRNALASGRLAQAFVFAGPRGVGKTTTARILARALNCINGPTADPCGACDACIEIAEGRDMDVLEIDAATHTGIDNIREVIIASLGIMPVRNRYKVFIIDEVHQLSTPSFNALLKSIEEPPPHVVFMMATTELDKIPETVLSRSQVYEFRTISTKAIADQAAGDRRPGRHHRRRRHAAADRARRRRQHARCAEQARSGHRVHRQDHHPGRCGDGAGAGRPRSAARHAAGGRRRGRAGLVRARRARGRDGLRPARGLPRAVAGGARRPRAVGRSLAHQRSGNRRRRGARSAEGAGRALLARGSAARVRSADARGAGHPQRGAAALSPRDGAAAVDSPAQAGADRGSDCGRRTGAQRRPDRAGLQPSRSSSAAAARVDRTPAPSALPSSSVVTGGRRRR